MNDFFGEIKNILKLLVAPFTALRAYFVYLPAVWKADW